MNTKQIIAVTSLALVFARVIVAAEAVSPERWRQALESDWLLQAQLDAEAQRAAQLTTSDDAAGGCDGVTNGKWGFHTAEQGNPGGSGAA
jgi:hypothetical protein